MSSQQNRRHRSRSRASRFESPSDERRRGRNRSSTPHLTSQDTQYGHPARTYCAPNTWHNARGESWTNSASVHDSVATDSSALSCRSRRNSGSRPRSRRRSGQHDGQQLLTYGDGFPIGTQTFAPALVLEQRVDPHQEIQVRVAMEENVAYFFCNEMEAQDRVWDLVVLIGNSEESSQSAGSVWATTVGGYIDRVWPDSQRTISKLFGLVQTESILQSIELRDSAVVSLEGIEMWTEWLSPLLLTVVLTGPAIRLTDLVEALIWLSTIVQDGTATVLPSTTHADLVFNKPRREHCHDHTATFDNFSLEIHSSVGADIHPETGSCWTELFPATPCATQFWSPERPPGMTGLELSFNLMCFLGGIQYEVIEGRGLVLYGDHSMIYPVYRTHNAIQWHFQAINDNDPVKHLNLGQRLMIDDLEHLRHIERHFLGLWSDTWVRLGTQENDGSQITWSKAEEVKRERYRDGFTVGGSVNMPKILSLNGTVSYKLARSRKNQYVSNFEADLQRKTAVPVILYSPFERRAWMIPYTSLLLHIARARSKLQAGLGFRIPPCKGSGDGGRAAFECLRRYGSLPLTEPASGEKLSRDERRFTIRDYVKDVSAAMETARRETCRAKGFLRGISDSIIGFELADLTRMRQSMTLKKCSLGLCLGSRGWAPVLDVVEYVFFCEGMPEPLIPGPTMDFSSPCGRSTWKKIPTGFNLLTASLPCLAYLAESHDPSGPHKLTRSHYWSMPDFLFGNCTRRGKHICSRLQTLSSRPSDPPAVSYAFAKENGAAVFRHKDELAVIQAVLNEQARAKISLRVGQTMRISDSGYSSQSSTFDDHSESVSSTETRPDTPPVKRPKPSRNKDEVRGRRVEQTPPARPRRHRVSNDTTPRRDTRRHSASSRPSQQRRSHHRTERHRSRSRPARGTLETLLSCFGL